MRALLTLVLVGVMLAGCGDEPGGVVDPSDAAVICTNFGAIAIELFHDRAPRTAGNFQALAERGYYDGVVFHRIMPNFMMQGGDPTGTGTGGETADGETLQDEFHPELRHDAAGFLSMANSGPDSGTSQFFLTFAPTPHLDDKHAIFGRVTEGMDVAERIEAQAASPQHGIPRVDVYMQEVLVGQDAAACPEPAGAPPSPEPFSCPSPGRQDLTGDVTADAITPGVLCITREQDQVLVWAQSQEAGSIDWSLTSTGGDPLPDGWSATFQPAAQDATAGATVHAFLNLEVPADAAGEHPLELRTGSSVTPVTAHVDLRHDLLTGPGDRVLLEYVGSCARDGQQFDAGGFGTTLASRGTVTGFDRGLVGMGEQETTTIVIPAALGYGNEGRVCAGADADLVFEVTITQRALRHASELE